VLLEVRVVDLVDVRVGAVVRVWCVGAASEHVLGTRRGAAGIPGKLTRRKKGGCPHLPERADVVVIGMGVGGEEAAGRLAEAALGVVGVERAARSLTLR